MGQDPLSMASPSWPVEAPSHRETLSFREFPAPLIKEKIVTRSTLPYNVASSCNNNDGENFNIPKACSGFGLFRFREENPSHRLSFVCKAVSKKLESTFRRLR